MRHQRTASGGSASILNGLSGHKRSGISSRRAALCCSVCVCPLESCLAMRRFCVTQSSTVMRSMRLSMHRAAWLVLGTAHQAEPNSRAGADQALTCITAASHLARRGSPLAMRSRSRSSYVAVSCAQDLRLYARLATTRARTGCAAFASSILRRSLRAQR